MHISYPRVSTTYVYRRRPGTGRSMGLSGKEIEALKELEERSVMEAGDLRTESWAT